MYIIKPIGELRFPTENIILLAIRFHYKIDLSVLLFLVYERDEVRRSVNLALPSFLL